MIALALALTSLLGAAPTPPSPSPTEPSTTPTLTELLRQRQVVRLRLSERSLLPGVVGFGAAALAAVGAGAYAYSGGALAEAGSPTPTVGAAFVTGHAFVALAAGTAVVAVEVWLSTRDPALESQLSDLDAEIAAEIARRTP